MFHSDAKEISQGKFWHLFCDCTIIPHTLTEPYGPWQNQAKSGKCERKRHANQKMNNRNIQMWDYCEGRSCDVQLNTASNLFKLEGSTSHKAVTVDTPNLSSLTDYDIYESIWNYDEVVSFPEPKWHIGQWLG
jgi:hypothetical protein